MKKLRKMTVGNLTITMVPEDIDISDKSMEELLEQLDTEDVDPDKEHNYYQV